MLTHSIRNKCEAERRHSMPSSVNDAGDDKLVARLECHNESLRNG